MKPHRRINHKTPLLPRRKWHFRLLVILWSLFLIAAFFLLIWVGIESRRLLAEYQNSPICASSVFTDSAQNCRLTISVPIYDKWMTSTAGFGGKGGGHFNKVNFIVGLPDGERRTLKVDYSQSISQKEDSFKFDFFSIEQFLNTEQGRNVQAEYWMGKVTTVTMKMPVMFNESNSVIVHTDDHPINYLAVNLTRTISVLAILLIALILVTGWDLLRQ